MTCSARWESTPKLQCPCHGYTRLHYDCIHQQDMNAILSRIVVDTDAMTLKCHDGMIPMEFLLSRCHEDGNDDDQSKVDGGGNIDTWDVVTCMMERFPGNMLHLKGSMFDARLGSRFMRASTNVQSLDLSGKYMTKHGMMTLLHRLGNNTTLRELSLSWIDHIDGDISQAFQTLFVCNTTLKVLNVRTCLLSPTELTNAQRAFNIGDNRTLIRLNIRLVPQYQLYLLTGGNDRKREHRVDTTELEMKLALNGALGNVCMGSTELTLSDFCNVLVEAGDCMSATFVLLKNWPHLWSGASRVSL